MTLCTPSLAACTVALPHRFAEILVLAVSAHCGKGSRCKCFYTAAGASFEPNNPPPLTACEFPSIIIFLSSTSVSFSRLCQGRVRLGVRKWVFTRGRWNSRRVSVQRAGCPGGGVSCTPHGRAPRRASRSSAQPPRTGSEVLRRRPEEKKSRRLDSVRDTVIGISQLSFHLRSSASLLFALHDF